MENDFATGYALGSDNNGGRDGGMWGGDGLWAIIIFAMIFGFGRGGFGGFGGGGADGALTRADLCDGFNFQNVENGIRGIQNGLCDGFYAQNTTMLQGFNGVERGLCDLSHQLSDCCCQTQRAIDGVNYNMATNTCNIIQSGHNDTDRVIAVLNQMESNRQQEKIEALRLENQTLRFQSSQNAQNGYIDAVVNAAINRIAPQPVPAYSVPAPYPYGGCNTGCGCC